MDNKEGSGRRSRLMTKPRETEVTFADRKLSEEYQAITELISELKRSRHSIKEVKKKRKPTGPVFGVSLEVVALPDMQTLVHQEGTDLPTIFSMCVDFLFQPQNLNAEGIFRHTGLPLPPALA